MSSPGATPDVSVRLILKRYGIVSDSDTKILYISGGSGLRLAALSGGSADAALLGSPYNKMAVQLGFRELVFMKDLVQVPFNGLAAPVTKLQTQPQSIQRTVRATLKGIRFIKENKDESLRFMAGKYGFNDKEVASLIYDDAVSLYLDTGIPNEASMKEAVESAKQGLQAPRELSASDVADWRFAREAYSSVRSGR